MDSQKPGRGIPVILDTDIGDDIDDTWALIMLLHSPELDIKLIITEGKDTVYRAKIVAKLLKIAGRTDIPIGIGLPAADVPGAQAAWVADYDLAGYPGIVHRDGVGALIDSIMQSPAEVTVIAIGPLGNLANALQRQPAIAAKARLVGMQGSVRKGYDGSETVQAEYNVAMQPEACRTVFQAPWTVTITPVDTCGLIVLNGEAYQKVYQSADPLLQALIENYRIWWETNNRGSEQPKAYLAESSVLFDTVAVYLAFDEKLLKIEELGITVTDDGYTRIDAGASKIRCATAWQDRQAFEDLLLQRLTRLNRPCRLGRPR